MRINNNLMAMNTHRQLGAAGANGARSMGKLASGLRINNAADDAAGLAISEKMRGQIRGLNQAGRNAQDGVSLIQTAEGALNETHAILQRMRELAVQASNDTNTADDRGEIQKEINQLTSEINRIGNTTEFNTKKLINGDMNSAADADMHTVGVAFDAGFTINTAHDPVVLTIGGTDYTINFDQAKAKASVTAADVNKATNTITVGINDAVDAIAADIAAGLQLLQGQTPQSDLAQFTISGTGNNLTITATETGKYSGAAGKDSVTLKSGLLAEKLTVAQEGSDGSGGAAQLQIGANTSQQFEVKILDMRAKALGISGDDSDPAGAEGAGFSTGAQNELTDISVDGTPEYALDVSNAEKATQAVSILDNAIKNVSAERSKLGAYQNRLEHTIKNLDTSSENLQASESRIRDVDMAKEMMEFTKNNILQQAAQAMLAQANQAPQGVLQLLR